MDPSGLVSLVLDDEGLTRDLDEREAEHLTSWAVKQVEQIAAAADNEEQADQEVGALKKRVRKMSRFIVLWCQEQDDAQALELAKSAGFATPDARLRDPLQVAQFLTR